MANFGMDFSKLIGQLDSVKKKQFTDDDSNSKDFWKLTKDDAGNGSAVIRFLPNKDINDFPFVRLWTHAFSNFVNGKKRWYIENSLSTIEKTDYIAEVNRELWNTQLDANKKIATAQKRKLNYISNILVVKDPGNPENEGKVFKFKYGQKIFDKIVAAAKPEPSLDDPDDTPEPVNAFSPIEGANFTLTQTIVADFPNYDTSKFGKQKALFNGDEDKIQSLLDTVFDLNLELALDRFKSYDELKKKFLWVKGEETTPTRGGKAPDEDKEAEDALNEMAKLAKQETPKPAPAKTVKAPVQTAAADDDEDDAALFASLIQD